MYVSLHNNNMLWLILNYCDVKVVKYAYIPVKISDVSHSINPRQVGILLAMKSIKRLLLIIIIL